MFTTIGLVRFMAAIQTLQLFFRIRYYDDEMKKVLLSGFVIFSFLFYSLHEQEEMREAAIVAPPTLLVTPTPTLTTISTPPPSGHQSATVMDSMMVNVYRNGTYTGSVEDVFYGNIQVQAVISGGKITDIIFLQYPNDRRTSVQISKAMMPILRQEAIRAQSARVNIVSGATDSSHGFRKSLAVALAQAK